MRMLLLGLTAALVGCGHDKAVLKIEMDERLTAPCPRQLPALKSTSDVDSLAWTTEMAAMYVKCAKQKDAIVKIIDDHNKGAEAK